MENKKRSRFYRKLVTSSLGPLYLFIGLISLFLCFYGDYRLWPWMTFSGLALAFVSVLFFMFHKNRRNLHEYINGNENISHLPEKQIRTANKLYMRVFLAITSLAMFLFSLIPADGFASKVWNLILDWFKKMYRSLFYGRSTGGKEEFTGLLNEGIIPDNALMKESEHLEHVDGLSVGDIIIIAIGCICIALLIVYGIYDLRKKIKERQKPEFLEEREFIEPKTEREEISRENLSSVKITDFSLNARVRRHYKKRIRHGLHAKKVLERKEHPLLKEKSLKEKKAANIDPESSVIMASAYNERTARIENSVLGAGHGFEEKSNDAEYMSYLTPTELEEYAAINKKDDTKRLHDLYEKARYSNEEVTKDEFNHL